MIQGKTDPRRPDRVQRYKAPQSNGNTSVEDLTPDYMNILGPESTSAGGAAAVTSASSNEPVPPADDQSPPPISLECDANAVNNIIPTSPQYGVAIIANNATSAHDAAADNDTCNKDAVTHTTPSRTNHVNSNNDRFKVVKIATLEPFRRGRWKCMDYVDENPPISTAAAATLSKSCNNNATQQQQYMQTQSLPQQHFQQLQQQFYQNLSATGAQVQFFYPPQSSAQQQANTTAFINAAGGGGTTAGATYYQQVIPNSSGGMTLVNYPGVQYVPANLIQTQAGSAFVPTSQNMNAQIPPNLQQSQTYAGPTSNVPTGGGQGQQQQAPLVNGHTFPPSNPSVGEQQQATTASAVAQQTASVTASTLPTHTHVAKNVQLTGQSQVPIQPASTAQYGVNLQQSAPTTTIFQTNTSTQVTPIASAIVTPSSMQPPVSNQARSLITTVTSSNNNLNLASVDVSTAAAAAAAVYSNPQFVASVNKIVESAVSMIDAAAANANSSPMQQAGQQHQHNMETQGDLHNGEQAGPSSSASVSGEDTTTKANPVVNAIDNKIEQAMDLVKSHLMFTVREEVEVLKEKIAELMERIQQLESENNMLRTQALPKQHVNLIQQQQAQQTASNLNLSTDTSPSAGQQQQQPQ